MEEVHFVVCCCCLCYLPTPFDLLKKVYLTGRIIKIHTLHPIENVWNMDACDHENFLIKAHLFLKFFY